jgi:hypothetical protein
VQSRWKKSVSEREKPAADGTTEQQNCKIAPHFVIIKNIFLIQEKYILIISGDFFVFSRSKFW